MTRKENVLLMKKNNKKGFTLAELLIVVAIIAVLVAISIPIFTSQLEKAKESTDMANIRSAYAEVMAAYLDDGDAHTISVKTESNRTDWKSGDDAEIAGIPASTILNDSKTTDITVEIDEEGNAKINGTAVPASRLDA